MNIYNSGRPTPSPPRWRPHPARQNDTFDNCFDDGFFDNDVDNYFTRGSEMILNPVVRCEPLEQRRIPRLLQRARSTHGVLGRVHADLPRFTRSDVFNTLH